MSGTTLREHLEAIRDRHPLGRDTEDCGCWHCLDSHDAVAALAILDEAERAQAWFHDCPYEDLRLVSDPGCASREPDGET